MAQNERRHDERDRLREACTDELRELHEADDDETTTPEMVDLAARTAARTARQLSRPDSDAPVRQAWYQAPAGKAGLLTLVAALVAAVVAGIVQGLQQAGVLK